MCLAELSRKVGKIFTEIFPSDGFAPQVVQESPPSVDLSSVLGGLSRDDWGPKDATSLTTGVMSPNGLHPEHKYY